MGAKSEEILDLTFDDLQPYLHSNHSIYMVVDGAAYYITDANDRYFRAQRTDVLNEKGHYVDCSELVPTIAEFVDLPFLNGQSVRDVFSRAKFYASVK